jgi:hypothetical protein
MAIEFIWNLVLELGQNETLMLNRLRTIGTHRVIAILKLCRRHVAGPMTVSRTILTRTSKIAGL